ncbi:hypothetical protein EEX84_06950 [Planococcus salinus]|uniref:Uncharacterized protein n=1 Tax=Planococcus salinus TaxID=1848460 RepID=A0A3M8P8W7_9BACL|nr:hypothetical protein EEX84_06950 [Planococcus salinus]
MAYDPRAWPLELDNRKAEVPVESRQALEVLAVMAFFAIAAKIEATSRDWAPELDNRKAEVPVESRQALEVLAVMAFLPSQPRSKRPRETGHRSWTMEKRRQRR